MKMVEEVSSQTVSLSIEDSEAINELQTAYHNSLLQVSIMVALVPDWLNTVCLDPCPDMQKIFKGFSSFQSICIMFCYIINLVDLAYLPCLTF